MKLHLRDQYNFICYTSFQIQVEANLLTQDLVTGKL